MNLQDAKKLLRTLVDVPIQVVRAKVKSVDTDNWTAEVVTETGGGERFDVQLRVLANGDGFGVITVPKDDSLVLIGLVENNPNACYMVQCSEVVMVRIEMDDKVLIEIPEDGKIKIKAEEVLFDGSKNGLVDIEKLAQRISNLESKYNTHTHSAFGGATGTPSVTVLPTTTSDDIKNDKITWQ